MPGGRLRPFARLGVGVARIVTTRGVVPVLGMRVKAPAARPPASVVGMRHLQHRVPVAVLPAHHLPRGDGLGCIAVTIEAPVCAQGIPMSHPVHGQDVPVALHRYPPRAVAAVPIVMIGAVVPVLGMRVKAPAARPPASVVGMRHLQHRVPVAVLPAHHLPRGDGLGCIAVTIEAPVCAQGIPMSHPVHGRGVRVGRLPRIPTRLATIRLRRRHRRHRPRRLATIRLHR